MRSSGEFRPPWGRRTSRFALDCFSPILHLIQTIRDEAHRFAVTFHRMTSELDQIPGIGEITVRKLLKEFGSSGTNRFPIG
ncbi:MAG TPA: hypothetical protein VMQ54_05930 [Steroidobacteraceae bacterium]|nr:hypothetical protein [Steroidobacteraceae bacterium]